MTLAIYQDLDGRRHWAESTSAATVRRLAEGSWTLYDSTPDTPAPPGDPFDLEMAERFDDPASASSTRLRAAPAPPHERAPSVAHPGGGRGSSAFPGGRSRFTSRAET